MRKCGLTKSINSLPIINRRRRRISQFNLRLLLNSSSQTFTLRQRPRLLVRTFRCWRLLRARLMSCGCSVGLILWNSLPIINRRRRRISQFNLRLLLNSSSQTFTLNNTIGLLRQRPRLLVRTFRCWRLLRARLMSCGCSVGQQADHRSTAGKSHEEHQ
jgi:hypothetical protein